MTRDEEINEMANYFAEDNYDRRVSYIEGAKWADVNPKSPWISVKNKLPDNDTKLYLIYCEVYNKNPIRNKHYEVFLANFDKEHSIWVNIESYNNCFFDVLYWMPIPELPI